MKGGRKAAFPIRQAWRIQKAEMPSAGEGGGEKGGWKGGRRRGKGKMKGEGREGKGLNEIEKMVVFESFEIGCN